MGCDMLKIVIEKYNTTCLNNEIIFINEEFYMNYIWDEIRAGHFNKTKCRFL